MKHRALLHSSPANGRTHNGTQNHTTVHNNKIRNHVCIKQISTSESENNDQLKVNSPFRPSKRKKKKCTKHFFFFLLYRKCNQSPAEGTGDQSDWSFMYRRHTNDASTIFSKSKTIKRPLRLNFTSWGGKKNIEFLVWQLMGG